MEWSFLLDSLKNISLKKRLFYLGCVFWKNRKKENQLFMVWNYGWQSCKLQKSTWETKNMYIMRVSVSVAELRAQTFASGRYKAICCRICCSHEAQDFAVDLSGTFWCSKGLQRSSEMCDIIVIVGTPQYTMLLTLPLYIYVNINCWQTSSRLFQNLKCKVSILKGHKRIPHFLTSVSQSFFSLDSGNSILKIIDVRIKKKKM